MAGEKKRREREGCGRQKVAGEVRRGHKGMRRNTSRGARPRKASKRTWDAGELKLWESKNGRRGKAAGEGNREVRVERHVRQGNAGMQRNSLSGCKAKKASKRNWDVVEESENSRRGEVPETDQDANNLPSWAHLIMHGATVRFGHDDALHLGCSQLGILCVKRFGFLDAQHSGEVSKIDPAVADKVGEHPERVQQLFWDDDGEVARRGLHGYEASKKNGMWRETAKAAGERKLEEKERCRRGKTKG